MDDKRKSSQQEKETLSTYGAEGAYHLRWKQGCGCGCSANSPLQVSSRSLLPHLGSSAWNLSLSNLNKDPMDTWQRHLSVFPEELILYHQPIFIFLPIIPTSIMLLSYREQGHLSSFNGQFPFFDNGAKKLPWGQRETSRDCGRNSRTSQRESCHGVWLPRTRWVFWPCHFWLPAFYIQIPKTLQLACILPSFKKCSPSFLSLHKNTSLSWDVCWEVPWQRALMADEQNEWEPNFTMQSSHKQEFELKSAVSCLLFCKMETWRQEQDFGGREHSLQRALLRGSVCATLVGEWNFWAVMYGPITLSSGDTRGISGLGVILVSLLHREVTWGWGNTHQRTWWSLATVLPFPSTALFLFFRWSTGKNLRNCCSNKGGVPFFYAISFVYEWWKQEENLICSQCPEAFPLVIGWLASIWFVNEKNEH